jgi:hypothetical protein
MKQVCVVLLCRMRGGPPSQGGIPWYNQHGQAKNLLLNALVLYDTSLDRVQRFHDEGYKVVCTITLPKAMLKAQVSSFSYVCACLPSISQGVYLHA